MKIVFIIAAIVALTCSWYLYISEWERRRRAERLATDRLAALGNLADYLHERRDYWCKMYEEKGFLPESHEYGRYQGYQAAILALDRALRDGGLDEDIAHCSDSGAAD